MDRLRFCVKLLFSFFAASSSCSCSFIADSLEDSGSLLGSPKGRSPHTLPYKERYAGVDTAIVRGKHLYYTTVEFSPDYYWQQDSLYGRAEACLALYRDAECLQRIPCGDLVTYDVDLHHLIDGHLYTECIRGANTVICRDGNELLVIPERVRLHGLVERDGVVYTMSRPIDSNGFCLRRGQDVMFRKDTGVLFGSFQDASYPETGALYMDAYSVVFWYGYGDELHLVVDGMDQLQQDVYGPFVDGKLYKSAPYRMPKVDDGVVWHRGSIWAGEGYCAHSGVRYVSGGTRSCIYEFHYLTVNDFGPPDAFTYVSSAGMAGIRYREDGVEAVFLPYLISASSPFSEHDAFAEGEDLSVEGSFRFISERCAILYGDELIVALSCNGRGECPRIVRGDNSYVLNINGFISSISISDN